MLSHHPGKTESRLGEVILKSADRKLTQYRTSFVVCLSKTKPASRSPPVIPVATAYPFTGIFEKTSIILPVVGRPKLMAGRKVEKISMFLISGESC